MRLIQIIILTLILAAPFSLQSQSRSDSIPATGSVTTSPHTNNYESDEEMNLFLSVFALLAISVMAGVAVITIGLALIVLVAIVALIGAGILSASIGVGLYKKSVQAGVRTAVILLMMLVCAVGGAALSWILSKLFDVQISIKTITLIGAGAGALGGMLAAFSIFWLIRKIFNVLRDKMEK